MFRRTISSFPRKSGYVGYLDVIGNVDTTNVQPSLSMAKAVANRNYKSWSVTMTTAVGMDLLHDSHFNKGTGFTMEERERLALRGLLPSKVSRLEDQVARVDSTFDMLTSNIEKYDYAMEISERNESLFYYWLMHNIEKLAPIIYTPTVGDACLRYGRLYKRAQGMFFCPEDQTHFLSMIHNWPREVDVIVVTDGGRILGLGDLGAHGMPIPVGKLALYTAVGGIHPARTLPIMLDVGTNNKELRESRQYFGWNGERLYGEEYYLMVDELMRAVKRRWPNCLVQFEDFTSSQAPIVLESYRDKMCCFNDDIQGTGSVVVAAMMNALRSQGKPISDLANTKIVVLGGGSAGYGVSKALYDAMRFESASPEQASANIYIMERDGPVTADRVKGTPLEFVGKDLTSDPFGVNPNDSILELIRKVKPDAIIGLTGCCGAFGEEAITLMGQQKERPIVFPLSNPTSRAECSFADALKWTDGRCIFGSGSPFDPVEYKGKKYNPTQTNNMYIFPGVGLGAVLCRSSRVTDKMFHIAAKALALHMSDEDLAREGTLFPGVSSARDVSPDIALKVIEYAMENGLARREIPRLSRSWVEKEMYVPRYGPVVRRNPEESSVVS